MVAWPQPTQLGVVGHEDKTRLLASIFDSTGKITTLLGPRSKSKALVNVSESYEAFKLDLEVSATIIAE